MPTSEKKVDANRVNAQKSCGPTNRTSTRYNATKHGLLARGVTELDSAEGYQKSLQDLALEMKPIGSVEKFLVEAAALDMVRILRARRLEAEFITSVLNPPTRGPNLFGDDQIFGGVVLDPGLPALIDSESGQKLVVIYQRYESTLLARLFRTLHELERLQRMRKGEPVPAPVAVDVGIQAEAGARTSADSSKTQNLGSGSDPNFQDATEIDHSSVANVGQSMSCPTVGSGGATQDPEESGTMPTKTIR